MSIMRDRLHDHLPAINQALFLGSAGFLVVFFGVMSQDDLPETNDDYATISGSEYADLLAREEDKTFLVDVRTEHAQTDVHANGLVQGVAYEDMGRELANQRDELKGKNLVFM